MVTQKMSNKEGFTLIELLVVVAIIAILAAIAIPQYAKYRKKAAEAAAASAVTSGITTLSAAYTDNGTTSITITVGDNSTTLSLDPNTNEIHYDNSTVDNKTFTVKGYSIWCALTNANDTTKVECK